MSDVLIWTGPVSTDMIRPYVPDSWDVRTYNQPDKKNASRIGSAAFGEWANTLGDDPLTTLASKDATRIVMAGFSAAHGAHEVILGKVARKQDPRLVGLFAADSYYSAWGTHTPKPGFRAWLRFALDNKLPAWFTTSTHHPAAHPSATESFLVMANSLGMLPVKYEGELAGPDVPDPKGVRAQGTIRWFDYGDLLKHDEHALKLAPIAMQNGPFLHTEGRKVVANVLPKPPAPSPGPSAPKPNDESGSNGGKILLLGLTAVGVGYLLNKVAS